MIIDDIEAGFKLTTHSIIFLDMSRKRLKIGRFLSKVPVDFLYSGEMTDSLRML